MTARPRPLRRRSLVVGWPAALVAGHLPAHAATLLQPPANPKGPTMNPNELAGSPLSADLVSAVADPSLEMLVLRLTALDTGVGLDGSDAALTGPARVQVVDVVRGRTWRAGQPLAMPVLLSSWTPRCAASEP